MIGHFWMFHSDGVGSIDRMNASGFSALKWAELCANDELLVETKHTRQQSCGVLCR